MYPGTRSSTLLAHDFGERLFALADAGKGLRQRMLPVVARPHPGKLAEAGDKFFFGRCATPACEGWDEAGYYLAARGNDDLLPGRDPAQIFG
jgi:hypothetical protein